jgi:hypothetical protein
MPGASECSAWASEAPITDLDDRGGAAICMLRPYGALLL